MSESSLKRWADAGLLEVARTAGGHRRITLREAMGFIRRSNLRVIKPEILGLERLSAAPGKDRNQALAQAVEEGNVEIVQSILVSGYLEGQSVAEMCDEGMAPAMHRVGELWKHGPEGIFIEHRAVDVCSQALHSLRSMLPMPQPDDPVAIGGSLEGDPYVLPSLMVACVLGTVGWRAVNLGPGVPMEALLEAVRQYHPAMVWLSCSVDEAARVQDRAVRKAVRRLAGLGIRVLAGGRAWNGTRWEPDSGIAQGNSMAEAVAFAEGVRGSVRVESRC